VPVVPLKTSVLVAFADRSALADLRVIGTCSLTLLQRPVKVAATRCEDDARFVNWIF
jgi:hypothetical protein